MPAYLTGLGSFLPGDPVPSSEMEEYIGSLGPDWTDLRDKVVTNSGIRTRHYAIDKQQRTVHTNATMAAEATRAAIKHANVGLDDIDFLAELAFMRYMLSDGAGAVVVRPRPAPDRLSLRIEWITLTSYANTTELCSYLGKPNNSPDYWGDYPSVTDAVADGALLLRQELSLLPGLIRICVDEYQRLLDQGRFDPAKLRYLGAHYSSEALRPGVLAELARRGLPYPPRERWFTNLHRIGNIGCASIYAILDELYRTQPLEPGDQVMCFVPEAARYAISYMLLTAVEPGDA